MQYVNVGKSGLKVSRLCLGMMTYGSPSWRNWILNEEQALPFVTLPTHESAEASWDTHEIETSTLSPNGHVLAE